MKKYLKQLKEGYGMMIFLTFTVAFVIGFTKLLPEPKTPTNGIPHNYYYPDEDVMWIGGNGDTIWE